MKQQKQYVRPVPSDAQLEILDDKCITVSECFAGLLDCRSVEDWGDQARARKSKTYSAYAIAALDIRGRLDEAARSQSEKGK